MSSPWGKISEEKVVNFQDIMSEELAKNLQVKEEMKSAKLFAEQRGDTEQIFQSLKDLEDYCDSDAVIARMLQHQFDKEYNEQLKLEECKYNGSSKVSVSFSNYRQEHPENLNYNDASDEDEGDVDEKDWDRFETVEKEFSSIPKCGYKNVDGNMITKHDILISGRRNAGKVMSFPPEFQTGDGAGFDMRLSNRVFNSLKSYSTKEQTRRYKVHDKKEDRATAEMGVDENTRILLYKLINRQLLERVNGIISTGKESVILHADSDPAYTECELPKECAIKVFKTTLSEFKTRDKYIKEDYRFKDRFSKQNPRKIIHLWAEKEMQNLNRLKRAGIPCPNVVALKKHILVMSFIGVNHLAASKLKDVTLNEAEWCIAYDQICGAMKKLYNDCELVHADLSEYNILWHDDKCWFIDVSQSVEHTHPYAYEFLLRDCQNVNQFFSKKPVPLVKSAEDLFIYITGFDSKTAMEKLEKPSKQKPNMCSANIDEHLDFDYFDLAWKESKKMNTEIVATE